MCRFIETIKVVDGKFQNIQFHNDRLNKTRSEVLGIHDSIDLKNILCCPSDLSGIVKCRVVYSQDIINIDYSRYQRRNIKSLKIVESNDIDYSYKYEDRNRLTELFGLRGDCDEVLIVKNGNITDTSFSNVVFFDGANWVTPESAILNGTKRQALLEGGTITKKIITTKDLDTYKRISLINSMLDIGDTEILIGSIYF